MNEQQRLMSPCDGVMMLPELGMQVSKYLWSMETSWLRATSRSARDLFVRNCPPHDMENCYFEAKESPGCVVEPPDEFPDLFQAYEIFEADDNANHHSMLRCWRLSWGDLKNLMWRIPLKVDEEDVYVRPLFNRRSFLLDAIAPACAQNA